MIEIFFNDIFDGSIGRLSFASINKSSNGKIVCLIEPKKAIFLAILSSSNLGR